MAVIAVLVAVAIPTFGNQLEKSRQATDVANLRDVYATAKLAVLNQGDSNLESTDPAKVLHDATTDALYCWAHPDEGKFDVATAAATDDQLYGKATTNTLRVDNKGLPKTIKYDGNSSLKKDDENGEPAGTLEKGILVKFTKQADSTYQLDYIRFYKNLPVELSFSPSPFTVELLAADYSTDTVDVVTFADAIAVTGGTAPYTFDFTSESGHSNWEIDSGKTKLTYKGDLSEAAVNDEESVSITVTDSTTPTAITGELIVTVKVKAAAATNLTVTGTMAAQEVAADASSRTLALPVGSLTFKYPDNGASATDGVTYTAVKAIKSGETEETSGFSVTTAGVLTVPSAPSGTNAVYTVTLTASATKGGVTYTAEVPVQVTLKAST